MHSSNSDGSIMLNAQVNDHIIVRNGILTIGGTPIERFKLTRRLGSGANGVVFAGQRTWLKQPCAVKIWLKLRANDNRNKVEQGLQEAQKMARAHPDWVPTLYDADLVAGFFFTSMELIPGEPLKEYLKRPLSKADRWWLARLYINAIAKTTTHTTAHGDAHAGNVMVFDHTIDTYEKARRLKLLDFGTSVFLGHRGLGRRHWRIVHETFARIVGNFENYTYYSRQQSPLSKRQAHLIVPFYDDVLDGLKVESGLYGKP